jgi:hypothetical protein
MSKKTLNFMVASLNFHLIFEAIQSIFDDITLFLRINDLKTLSYL